MANRTYNVFKRNLAQGLEDLEAGDYRALLLVSTVDDDPDYTTVAAAVAANTEASDGSYARQTVDNPVVSVEHANDRAVISVDDIDFGALDNETPTAVLIYRHVTTDSDSIPCIIVTGGMGVASNGAGYMVTFPNGVARVE
jgi:hypothetical protein